ncbi:MAG: Response regulator consisting of a CheY-like receiver domain and a winged-helix DNA-binding domain [Clostridia bacterium]|jgi:DNA-binding response OmpR family regulator|nr:Response regulator consisting of a CheY-like receiver domain and a winged-helix DNA-binding domain [Clostridia bacterium]
MVKVLIADDEALIRDLIKEYLDFAGYSCMECGDGYEALQLLRDHTFDIVLLDIMMPKIDGFYTAREIRKFSDVPIIVLSARCEEYDKLFGFELGIDDYITKPFSPKELLARIQAVLKRTQRPVIHSKPTLLSFEGLQINEEGRELYIDGSKVSTTPKEFDLLLYLIKNKNRVLSREMILNKVWEYEFFGEDRTVDTHIKMLRNTLGPYRKFIKTAFKVGYKFEDNI